VEKFIQSVKFLKQLFTTQNRFSALHIRRQQHTLKNTEFLIQCSAMLMQCCTTTLQKSSPEVRSSSFLIRKSS